MIPLRILQVVTIMNRGGLETMLMNYYRNIDRRRIQFDFLVHRHERGAYDDEIEALGGKIYRIMPVKPFALGRYKAELADFFVNHHEYQIVHAHLNALSFYALKAAKKNGAKCTIAHSHISITNPNTPLRAKINLKAVFAEYCKLQIGHSCAYKFACGKEAGKWMYGSKEKFIVMHNAVDCKKFAYNSAIRNQYRMKLGIENKFVVGHVARFGKEKNHDLLLRIFFEIYKMDKNSILLLIGDGVLKNKIIKQVKLMNLENAVRFLGVREDVSALMQAFDVFVFPSLHEGLPVVSIEAQAAGLNCFFSDGISEEAGITDLAEYISLKQSPSFWAERILTKHKEAERKDMSGIMRRTGYDIQSNAKWLHDFYFNIVKGESKGESI